MSETELVKKMLRAVLQSKKNGVSLSRLQSEYRSLTGEFIPHKQFGYPSLEMYLQSIPSVVKMERSRTGEATCFAAVCNETAHIAQLVARQRNSKKTGKSQLVNCQMRVKPATPFMPNAKPRTSLRQPDHTGRTNRSMTQLSMGSRSGVYGQVLTRDLQPDAKTALMNRTPTVQMRKPPTVSERSEKRMNLPTRFQKELHAHLSRNTQQINTNLQENIGTGKSKMPQSSTYNEQVVQAHLKEILSKYSNGFWVSKLPQLYRELYHQELPNDALKELEFWTHVCIVEKPGSTNSSELLLYPAKDTKAGSVTAGKSPALEKRASPAKPDPPVSPQSAAVAPEIRLKLTDLLAKYSNGLWAHALPKLFQDTYKMKFPEYILNDLSLLSDVCTIDYPMPDNTQKAILYARNTEDENQNRLDFKLPQASEASKPQFSTVTVPLLVIPKEEYPSVLLVEASNTNEIVLRYIGEGYSQSLEALEDKMREFYSEEKKFLQSPAPGNLAAVRAEEEDEILRVKVCEVMADGVKVYYVDHGFFEIINKSKLLELDERFYTLPFQATKCKLAGLEPFSQEAAILKCLESIACGKILLAEILEREEVPLVVLYDTSQDDDVNINTSCLKALQDKSLENSLKVNSVYMNVAVTNICSDGTIYCQLPCRGQTKLSEVLEKVEKYFHSKISSEALVSKPFCGKWCLARYKGKWSRVEITNLHGSRVLDIQFLDLGVPASVEVIELREIPPPFLRELVTIPPQAMKCCLADLPVSVRSWTPEAVLWLRDSVLNCTDCSIKVARVDESKGLIHIYLFPSKNFYDMEGSINQKIADSSLWKHQKDVFLSSSSVSPVKTSSESSSPSPKKSQPEAGDRLSPTSSLLPPLLELPQVGQNLDIFVSVACHPGHFVFQPWKDLYKLVVLMGEMILYYNKMEGKPIPVEKNQICAAKVENNWHRVLVKGILTNGLVSVYELDYGKHELVSCTVLQPLIEEFRQLPFQGVRAQLAGVKERQWSEEVSIVFRNHVEKKPLVAQIEAIHEGANPWERRVVVYLVDTAHEEKDVWVHDLMSEFAEELTKAA
ncbi:tudor domain-containing protein 7B [Lepisosteus oculatus]|uniref:tudor domain-containing protein 7B n=1 Tax=Lepisosteus oculatus TaxID=7918 RepID=UPI0035F513E1